MTRLSGHGVPYEGTNQMQIDKIMYDVAEAIIIGERTIETGEIELKERQDEKPKLVSHQDLVSIIKG